ncbi:MAG: hypothetical protein KGN37_13635 [Burkholderiales bacterium]|nr:hypothetical protein [Burkholderiales bacterium]
MEFFYFRTRWGKQGLLAKRLRPPQAEKSSASQLFLQKPAFIHFFIQMFGRTAPDLGTRLLTMSEGAEYILRDELPLEADAVLNKRGLGGLIQYKGHLQFIATHKGLTFEIATFARFATN